MAKHKAHRITGRVGGLLQLERALEAPEVNLIERLPNHRLCVRLGVQRLESREAAADGVGAVEEIAQGGSGEGAALEAQERKGAVPVLALPARAA